jgi:hypothetical protein
MNETIIAAIGAAAVNEERALRASIAADKALDREKATAYAAHLAHVRAVAVRDDAERTANKASAAYSNAYRAKRDLTKKLLAPPVVAAPKLVATK